MHELSLAQGIIDLLLENSIQQHYRQVVLVRLEVGQLSCVEVESIRFCFELVCQDTLAENAVLDIIEIKGGGRCDSCHCVMKYERLYDPCPQCGGYEITITQGHRVQVRDVEVV